MNISIQIHQLKLIVGPEDQSFNFFNEKLSNFLNVFESNVSQFIDENTIYVNKLNNCTQLNFKLFLQAK